MWQVSVNATCVGSGMCVGIAPGRFRLTRAGQSQVTDGEIAPDDAVLDAAASCPMEAILVIDGHSGQVLEP